MVGPVKEPFCRVHRENFPMSAVKPYSNRTCCGWLSVVLAGSVIGGPERETENGVRLILWVEISNRIFEYLHPQITQMDKRICVICGYNVDSWCFATTSSSL